MSLPSHEFVSASPPAARLRLAHVQARNFANSEQFTSLGHFSLGPIDVDALYAEAAALAEASVGVEGSVYVALEQPDSLGARYPYLTDMYTRIGEVETRSRDGDSERLIAGIRGYHKYLEAPVADEMVASAGRPHIDMVPITSLDGFVVPLYTTYIACGDAPTLTFPQEHSAGIDMGTVEQPEGVVLCKPPYPLEETIDRLAAVSDVTHPEPIAAGELSGVMGLHSAPHVEAPTERTVLIMDVRRCSTNLFQQVLGRVQQLRSL